MLISGAPLIKMLNQFRIMWLMSGYGSGKTLGAYQLAWELYKTGRYRYILGNSNSVWTDSPESVVLRDGSYVDAIVILDEGGLFMRLGSDAEAFMLGLRKLNITILIPSVLPPSSRVKFLQMQRVLNLMAFGLPAWVYQYRLNLGMDKEKAYATIWQPQEIYGIYDTMDYPVDDCYLSDWLQFWMFTAKESRPEWVTWGQPPKRGSLSKRDSRGTGQDREMDSIRGIIEEVIERSEDVSESLSLHAFEARSTRRTKRI